MLSFNDFLHKFNLKNGNIKEKDQQVRSSFTLSDVGTSLSDGPIYNSGRNR